MNDKTQITQCTKLINGKRCVLVSGHRGTCVEPIPRTDMSDVIRYRLASDNHAAAQEKIEVLETLVEIAMETLDWVSTVTEGTSKEPFLTIHRRVAVAMQAINLADIARGEHSMQDHPCAGPVYNMGPVIASGPYCTVGCRLCGATCQIAPEQPHDRHYGYYAGQLHSWAKE
jgi:hypothetical protein